MMRTTAMGIAFLFVLAAASSCERGGRERGASGETEIDEDLGALKVMNGVDEPVAIHLDGQEIFTVAPGRSYTFHNLPTGKATIYGVGRISQKHYGLPELEIEEGGEYEWTIHP